MMVCPCKLARYCGKECQLNDCKAHKKKHKEAQQVRKAGLKADT